MMSNELLRLNKGSTTAKLQLSLFTATLDDNRDLAARVAHLETEIAGVALSYGKKAEGFYALVAAAAAYRELGNFRAAAGCLEKCRGIGSADKEMVALLTQAIADLAKQLNPVPALKAKAPALKAKAPALKAKAPALKAKAPALKAKAPALKEKVPAPKEKAPKKEIMKPLIGKKKARKNYKERL